MRPAIIIKNLSKQYRLGQVGTGTISHDINRWWARVRGKEDPYSKLGKENRRDSEDSSGYVWALKNVSLEVPRGEILGIIGDNGAGKSTLLKVLSRITAPTNGRIAVGGRMASLLEVGTGMHPEMTARENVFLNGCILGMKRREIKRKFDDIIDFAGCRLFTDTPVKRFSSGMRVRLGFAVAAFLEPEILVVDEVLAVGDAEFQRRAVGKMQDISRKAGRTILFVSHNMSAVSNLCNSVTIMNNGELSERMQTERGISVYLSRRAKNFHQSKYLQNIEFTSDLGRGIVSTGSHGKIQFHVSGLQDEQEVVFALIIKTMSQQRLAMLHTKTHPSVRLPNSPDLTIECEIPCLPLTPGQYRVELSIGAKNKGVIDRVEDALLIDVIYNNTLQTGQLPRYGQGNLVIPARFNLVQPSPEYRLQ